LINRVPRFVTARALIFGRHKSDTNLIVGYYGRLRFVALSTPDYASSSAAFFRDRRVRVLRRDRNLRGRRSPSAKWRISEGKARGFFVGEIYASGGRCIMVLISLFGMRRRCEFVTARTTMRVRDCVENGKAETPSQKWSKKRRFWRTACALFTRSRRFDTDYFDVLQLPAWMAGRLLRPVRAVSGVQARILQRIVVAVHLRHQLGRHPLRPRDRLL
jgi:hypothetical protein